MLNIMRTEKMKGKKKSWNEETDMWAMCGKSAQRPKMAREWRWEPISTG